MYNSLDINSNIDLDYSGTSAALDVRQSSTGAAAQFTGAKVIVGEDTSNAYALSTGELYVQGDLEVDGVIYGTISDGGTSTLGATTISSLTVTGTSDLQGDVSDSVGDFTIADNAVVTGTSDLQGNVSDSAGIFTIADNADITPAALTSGGTDDYAISIAQTLNDTGAAGGSDVYRGIKLNVTETDTTGWDNVYLMDLQVDGTSQLNVDNSGNATFTGTVGAATPTTGAHVTTKAYVDAMTPATAGGWTDSGDTVHLSTAGDSVSVGTDDAGAYKFNVDGAFNATSVYIDGSQLASTDLTDTASLAMLAQDETITGNWVNTDNPWADNEVADTLTIDGGARTGGTIDNTVIGGTTPVAGTFTNLTFENTGSAAIMTFDDGTATDALTYDSTADQELYFSGAMSAVDFHIRGSSPAVLSFGSNDSGTSLIYDPATDEIRFSRGTFIQSSRNLIKNASFEAFSALEDFHAYDADYTTGTATTFDGLWDKTDGYQGGWSEFAPDDWMYVSGHIYQHSPVFFKAEFTEESITDATWKEDVTEGVSAVRIEVDDSENAGKIQQVVKRKRLKPSTVYSVGVKMRVDTTVDGGSSANIDILGEDGGNPSAEDNTSTVLSGNITATAKIIPVSDATDFPPFGTILVDDGVNTERIRYEGIEDNEFLKCTRANTAYAFSSGDDVTVAPFVPLTTSTNDTYKRFEGQFATDPKASEITIVLSAETGVAFFDTVQIVAGGTVPEYAPAPVVDAGDQTLYGSLRIGRSSDEKGGILSVDKFVRTRGLELFTDDPGLTGTSGGGATTMGGGGIFPPGPGWNEVDFIQPTVFLYVSGSYSTSASSWRDYKIMIDDDDGEGAGTTGTTYTWYYMDDSTGWIHTQGGTGIAIPTTPTYLSNSEALSSGVMIEFSAGSGTRGDTWWFNASNETYYQDDFSYQETAAYTPGKVRIYVDPDPSSPYFNQMVFEDGATKVSLSDMAGTVDTESYISYPQSFGSNTGMMGIYVSGNYTGMSDSYYEVQIDANGTGTATSPSNDTFKYRINSGVWQSSQEITGSNQIVGNGVYVSFSDPNYNGYYLSGVPNDAWTFTAYAGNTATETKVSSLDGKTGAITFQGDGNINIGSSGDQIITLSLTGSNDTDTANELNTSMDWIDASNTVSVTDAGGAKSVVITGFLESESDPKVGVISDNYVPKWGGTALSTGTIYDDGHIGIGTTGPTALLHLTSGTAALAPLKLTSGVNLSSAEAGAMEFDGANLYFTPAAARKTIAFTDSNITGTSANVTGIVANANGGTGQNSAAWTGYAKVSSGAWSAGSIVDGDLPGT
ncbi:hypothetical protein ACFL2G_05435, partial [Candidatus Omnitrophota bacterium]